MANMSEQPTFQIPQDVINPIIEAHVSGAVMKALQGYDAIVAKIVTTVLNMPVDNEGKYSNYSSNKKWIDWAVAQCIQKAAKQAIEEHMAANVELIKKQIAKELTNSRSPIARKLVEAIAAKVTNAENLRWGLTVSVKCDD